MDIDKEKLNSSFWPVLIVGLVCLISTALLALTNEITTPSREAQAQARELASKQKVFPEAEAFTPLEIPTGYQDKVLLAEKALGPDQELLGYLLLGQGDGYGGKVTIFLGVNTEGILCGVDVPANEETPGLGQKVRDSSFYEQFIGLQADGTISLASASGAADATSSASVPAGGQPVDAISGATASTKAVLAAANHCLNYYRELILPQLTELPASYGLAWLPPLY